MKEIILTILRQRLELNSLVLLVRFRAEPAALNGYHHMNPPIEDKVVLVGPCRT